MFPLLTLLIHFFTYLNSFIIIYQFLSILFYSRLCPSSAGSSPPPESISLVIIILNFVFFSLFLSFLFFFFLSFFLLLFADNSDGDQNVFRQTTYSIYSHRKFTILNSFLDYATQVPPKCLLSSCLCVCVLSFLLLWSLWKEISLLLLRYPCYCASVVLYSLLRRSC